MHLRSLLPLSLVLGIAGAVAACSSETPSTSGTPAPTPSSSSSTSPDDVPDAEAPQPVEAGPLTAYTEAEVQKLFDVRCVRCHDATSPNVDLSAPFTKDTVGVKVGGASGGTICGRGSALKLRIAPGDREASLLWHKVKGTQDCGSSMPFDNGNKPLDATELERLGLYIDGLAK
jgi:hypothetical protein